MPNFSSQNFFNSPEAWVSSVELLQESIISDGQIEISKYAEYLKEIAPARYELLRKVLNKIEFQAFHGKFIVDARLPISIGGYWNPENEVIAINPYFLLFGSEIEIATILIHEGLHAGIFTNNIELPDESMTQLITQEIVNEKYNNKGMKTAYDGGVEELRNLFGNEITLEDLIRLASESDEETFNNILESILVGPSILEQNTDQLRWDQIEKNLSEKWEILIKLFPRLINSVDKKRVGAHETATMSMSDFKQKKFEDLLKQIAQNMIEKHEKVLVKIINEQLINLIPPLTVDAVIKSLYIEGYGYLIDYQSEIVVNYVKEYISDLEEQRVKY
jgi:hypothetical protein